MICSARLAAEWLHDHRSNFSGQFAAPQILFMSDTAIEMKFKELCNRGVTCEELRDWTLFNFDSASDLALFDDYCRQHNWAINVALHGEGYISEFISGSFDNDE